MGEDERKLYVGNLPGDIAQGEVKEVFGLYGTIEEVHINVPKDGRSVSARSAFVRFEDSQDAAAAMAVLSDMYKFREISTPVRVNLARPTFGMPGGRAGGGRGYGETGGHHGGWDPGSSASGGAANGIATTGADANAARIPAPPPLMAPPAAPPPPTAASSRPDGGHPSSPPPPPPPAPSSHQAPGGASPSGGGSQWGDGYGRAQSRGGPDGARPWGTDAFPSDAGGGGGGGRDPVTGRDLGAKLWVGNLPADIAPQQVEDVFKSYGKVEDVSVLPNKSRSGQVCAFVHFATPAEADVCIQAMAVGYELRPGEGELRVERAAGRSKGGGYGDKGKGGKRGYQPY